MKPEKLRLDPDRPYAFKSPLKRGVARMVDKVGRVFFKPSPSEPDWKSFRKVAVLRLDHLGDVLLALPAVQALEKALPQTQVDFIVGPWAGDIAAIAGLRSSPRIFAASWFARGAKGQGVAHLEEFLRKGGYDAAIDLRGDFRHIWAIYRADILHRIGPTKTGLGFLLTRRVVPIVGTHEIQRNFDSLEQAGLHLSEKLPYPRLFVRPEDDKIQKEARRRQGIIQPVIAIHAICMAMAKRWPQDRWARLLEELPRDMDIVLIGTEEEKPQMEEIARECKRKLFLAAGLLKLPALAAFLKDCRMLIGVDSGPAHIAAALGIPVVSLYSGTNLAGQWGPRGPGVHVLQKKTPCSPCERADCPIGNECMKQIGVDEVLDEVKDVLKENGA